MAWMNLNKPQKTSGASMENCTGFAKELAEFGKEYFDVISLEDKKELLDISRTLVKAKNCLNNLERRNLVCKFKNIKSRYVR